MKVFITFAAKISTINVKTTMKRKMMMLALLTTASMGSTVMAQESGLPRRHNVNDYFVVTSNVRDAGSQQVVATPAESEGSSSEEVVEKRRKAFIDRNFRYVSMCDWEPGMRFMVRPTQKDLVVKIFTDATTGNMVSTRSLNNAILVYEGHSNPNGSLHEQVVFSLESDPAKKYYYEVPTLSFDDYCYSKNGIPALAYLGDVDMAIDSLTGKQVRVLQRYLFQDTEVAGDNFKSVDIGDAKRGTVMTITKVGVGTRDFPVKIVVKEPNKNGLEGQEYFMLCAISRTNCSLRDEDFEKSDNLPHAFQSSFQLLNDRMAVTPELQAWVGKNVFTAYETDMLDEAESHQKIGKLSSFVITDMYKLVDSDIVSLTLKGKKSGKTYTKQVSVTNTKVTGKEEVLNELFLEGDPNNMAGVRAANMQAIQKGQVKIGFTEAEVRLAIGEPSDVTRVVGGTYQWIYQFEDANRPFRSIKFSNRTKKVTAVAR